MTRRSLPALFLIALLAAPLAASPAGADGRKGRDGEREEDDHDAARAAVRRGEALPLSEVIAAVAATLPGEIVEVEFEREHGRWVYEFKVLDRTGRLRDVHVDAATAGILSDKDD